MVSGLDRQAQKNQKDIAALQASQEAMQLTVQKSQELSSKQEQMIANWEAAQQGNLDKWYVAEAQYLVKLADDQLQFNHNVAAATTLITRADRILQKVQAPDLLEIRKSLAADLARLQAVPQVDTTALYLQLTALNHQIDQLPLPPRPLKTETASAVTETKDMPWWKAGLYRSWDSLRKIVIVRYDASPSLPLVMPEEKAFLYQNMHAQMEGAMWAVLHRDMPVYQTSLARVMVWTHRYFDQDAQATQVMLQQLQELIKVNVEPPTVNFANSLQLFDQYFAKAGAAQ